MTEVEAHGSRVDVDIAHCKTRNTPSPATRPLAQQAVSK
jgi:hypothetical protein